MSITTNDTKPHMGRIKNWSRVETSDPGPGSNLPYFIVGTSTGHPRFDGCGVYTSPVTLFEQTTPGGDIEIETLNSRYTLDIHSYLGTEPEVLNLKPGLEPRESAAETFGDLEGVRPDIPGSQWPAEDEPDLGPPESNRDYMARVLNSGPPQDDTDGLVLVPGYGFVPARSPAAEIGYETAKKLVEAYEREERLKAENPLTRELRAHDLYDMTALLNGEAEHIKTVLARMIRLSHGISVIRGWHDKPREDGTRIALMHSELSEMLEGVRKDSMDDHLPERYAEEVEAADLLIRLLDHIGFKGLDIAGAYIEKSLYNIGRRDHDIQAREKPGGKAF